jgi:hypothetical protein
MSSYVGLLGALFHAARVVGLRADHGRRTGDTCGTNGGAGGQVSEPIHLGEQQPPWRISTNVCVS